MKKPGAEEKDLINQMDTINHFKLSSRKFNALMKSKEREAFTVMYNKRKLIIRSEFEKYLAAHPELRRCR